MNRAPGVKEGYDIVHDVDACHELSPCGEDVPQVTHVTLSVSGAAVVAAEGVEVGSSSLASICKQIRLL